MLGALGIQGLGLTRYGVTGFPMLADGVRATSDMDFVSSRYFGKALADLTCTRASAASYFDASGVLQQASNNVLRRDFDPVTLACRGLLIEEARTNLMIRSAEFENAAWTKFGLRAFGSGSVADAVTAPSGVVAADLIVEDTSGPAAHGVQRITAITPGNTITLTLFAKAKERTSIQVNAIASPESGSVFASYDLAAGTAGATLPSGDLSTVATSIENVGGGWYRCRLTVATVTAQNIFLQVRIANGATTNYVGDGVSGLYIWGAQVEVGSMASSYIPTTTATVTRAADQVTMNTPPAVGTEVSIYAEATTNTPDATAAVLAGWVNNASPSANNRAYAFVPGSARGGLTVTDGGAAQAAITVAGTHSGTIKLAAAIKANDFSLATGGTLGTPDTSGTLPTGDMDKLVLGSAPSSPGTDSLNGHLRRIAIWSSRRVSDADLQRITT